jgi:hypothetical protein
VACSALEEYGKGWMVKGNGRIFGLEAGRKRKSIEGGDGKTRLLNAYASVGTM